MNAVGTLERNNAIFRCALHFCGLLLAKVLSCRVPSCATKFDFIFPYSCVFLQLSFFGICYDAESTNLVLSAVSCALILVLRL